MALEQLIVFIVFLAVGLFNLLARIFRERRQRERQQGRPAAEPAPPPTPVRSLPPRVVIPPTPPPPERPAPPAARRVRPVPAAPAVAALRQLGTPAGLRRAIVLTTVLGPCRALERPDSGESSRGTS